MFLLNWSLQGNDASCPLAPKHSGCGALWEELVPASCNLLRCKSESGKCYPWLSPQLGDTWGTCVLFFLKLRELEHSRDRCLTNPPITGE